LGGKKFIQKQLSSAFFILFEVCKHQRLKGRFARELQGGLVVHPTEILKTGLVQSLLFSLVLHAQQLREEISTFLKFIYMCYA